MITQDRLKDVLDYDPLTGIFRWKIQLSSRGVTGAVAGHPTPTKYVRIRIDSQSYTAHRLAWLYVYGVWPNGELDHINQNKHDNRIANLRDVTHQQNGWNIPTKCSNTSGHPGVSWDKERSKWLAVIRLQDRRVNLGRFTDINDAIAAREQAVAARNATIGT